MTEQHHPFKDRQLALIGARNLTVRPGVETARFSLRIAPAVLDKASKIFGLALPEKIGALTLSPEEEGKDRRALCLGPDEWYLTAPVDAHDQIMNAFEKLYESEIHSLVDISGREISIVAEGADAAFLLQAAIAFDVETLPVPGGRRTLLDKAQIILMRERLHHFRIEVWASFAEHVWNILDSTFNEIKSGL